MTRITRRNALKRAAATTAGVWLSGFGPSNLSAAPRELRFEIYRDGARYRWCIKSGNNEIVADSCEAHVRKSTCMHAIDLIRNGAAGAQVQDQT